MLLFKPEHIELMKKGIKTHTRRLWKKPRAKKGSIHQVKLRLFENGNHGFVRIKDIWKEMLLDISEEDAQKEGGYTREQFLIRWFEINRKSPENPEVHVLELEYYEDDPTELSNEQHMVIQEKIA